MYLVFKTTIGPNTILNTAEICCCHNVAERGAKHLCLSLFFINKAVILCLPYFLVQFS